MNGGYIMLDMQGLDLTETDPQTITGIHARVTAAAGTGKPVYLTGVEDASPIQAVITPGSSGAFILLFLTYSATVTSPSTVTVASLITE